MASKVGQLKKKKTHQKVSVGLSLPIIAGNLSNSWIRSTPGWMISVVFEGMMLVDVLGECIRVLTVQKLLAGELELESQNGPKEGNNATRRWQSFVPFAGRSEVLLLAGESASCGA